MKDGCCKKLRNVFGKWAMMNDELFDQIKNL